jgi:hypothetical protein
MPDWVNYRHIPAHLKGEEGGSSAEERKKVGGKREEKEPG